MLKTRNQNHNFFQLNYHFTFNLNSADEIYTIEENMNSIQKQNIKISRKCKSFQTTQIFF